MGLKNQLARVNHDYIITQVTTGTHEAVAEVSRIGNPWERLIVVNHGWQSKNTDKLSNCLTD